ncbi:MULTISPECIES: hypothetical protein [Calothrix]|uniref:Uncharacterized protein n=2 Tax=Calothrix TaxID=1186 RepID=A0ABR8AM73_9CYAN|nr:MULTISPECIES: hypothetical protein [Calothrix]MBD2199747.1 hypothetical protein [Calothrix parietina FACHB-288]MBD2228544.1 hypothetical protein [Calothrix anomala FACHB-343]
MAETFSYQGVTVKIFETQAGDNIALKFQLFDKQDKEIKFLPTGSTVSSYKRMHKDLLVQDAKREIDRLMSEGLIG